MNIENMSKRCPICKGWLKNMTNLELWRSFLIFVLDLKPLRFMVFSSHNEQKHYFVFINKKMRLPVNYTATQMQKTCRRNAGFGKRKFKKRCML